MSFRTSLHWNAYGGEEKSYTTCVTAYRPGAQDFSSYLVEMTLDLMVLFRKCYRPRFPDHGYLDLARVGHFGLDTVGYIRRQYFRLCV